MSSTGAKIHYQLRTNYVQHAPKCHAFSSVHVLGFNSPIVVNKLTYCPKCDHWTVIRNVFVFSIQQYFTNDGCFCLLERVRRLNRITLQKSANIPICETSLLLISSPWKPNTQIVMEYLKIWLTNLCKSFLFLLFFDDFWFIIHRSVCNI